MLRFTIRDLLWLMVAVGLGFGWWLDRQQITRTNTAHLLKLAEEQFRLELEIATLRRAQ